jgi:hypothetical protein
VIEELSSIAAVRAVRLVLVGTCAAKLRMAESRLRLALQYLITTMIEAQTVGGKVVLLLGEDPAGTVLRGEGERGFRELAGAAATLRRVRLAIAGRVLESAEASLVLGDADAAGFVLCIRAAMAILSDAFSRWPKPLKLSRRDASRRVSTACLLWRPKRRGKPRLYEPSFSAACQGVQSSLSGGCREAWERSAGHPVEFLVVDLCELGSEQCACRGASSGDSNPCGPVDRWRVGFGAPRPGHHHSRKCHY